MARVWRLAASLEVVYYVFKVKASPPLGVLALKSRAVDRLHTLCTTREKKSDRGAQCMFVS
jgi:hypothetical protein